jgi:pimeloyl-ACP methyl ester carboxylesterase
MNFESSFVTRQCPVAGEIKLHKISCGPKDAPALLFVHGFPEFWYGWIEQLREFSRDYRCHAIDLRGFNLSSQPLAVSAYRAPLLIDDLRAVINSVGGHVRAVVAHDWGGAVAWSLAAQSPQLMDRFIVANSPHAITFAHALAFDAAQIEASQYMNWLRAEGSESVLAEAGFARLVAMASLKTEEQLARYRECWSRGLTGGVNLYRASPLHPDTAEAVGTMAKVFDALKPEQFRVQIPTQIIWGTGDTALRPVLLDGIETHVPQVRIDRIEGASHWLLRENSSEVNRLVRSFIEQPEVVRNDG